MCIGFASIDIYRKLAVRSGSVPVARYKNRGGSVLFGSENCRFASVPITGPAGVAPVRFAPVPVRFCSVRSGSVRGPSCSLGGSVLFGSLLFGSWLSGSVRGHPGCMR